MTRGILLGTGVAAWALLAEPAAIGAENRWDWLELTDPFVPGTLLRHSLEHGRGTGFSKTTLWQVVSLSDDGIAMGLSLPWVIAETNPYSAQPPSTPRLGGDPYPSADLSVRLWKPDWGFLGVTLNIGVPYDGSAGGVRASYTYFGTLFGRWARASWVVDTYLLGGRIVTVPLQFQDESGNTTTLRFLPTPAFAAGATAFRILSNRWVTGLALSWFWVGAFDFELSGVVDRGADPSLAGNFGPTFVFRSGDRSFFQATLLLALGSRSQYSTTLATALAWTWIP